MQNHIKYLVVENESEWADQIGESVRNYFEQRQGFAKARVRDFSALNAVQANQQILEGGWDLVMLDMNLGEGAGKSKKISGLDLLGEIAKGNRAFFVIIITGVVTDTTVEEIYGKETADLLRFGTLNEAVRRMPAARVRILHKPTGVPVSEAMQSLLPHLHSSLDQYCSVSLERNIFRPLPRDPKLWEICFNGGARITIPTKEPYKMIRSALAQPDRALKVIQLMQALANSSGRDKATALGESKERAPVRSVAERDYRGHQEDEVNGADGLDFAEMDGFQVVDHAPVDVNEGTLPLESIIGALLQAKRRGLDLATAVGAITTKGGINEEALLSIPATASKWAAKRGAADAEFGCDGAAAKLMALVHELKPLLRPILERWLERKALQAVAPGKKLKGSSGIRVARGVDTPEMKLARQHWKRFLSKAYIGGHPTLREFKEHIVEWIPRGDPTAKGNLHYKPPGNAQLCPFWLTD